VLQALEPLARPVVCLVAAPPAEEMELLEAGASLCLAPDISAEELAASLGRLLDLAPAHSLADLELDPLAQQARRGGVALGLRPVEFAILLHLAQRPGRVVSRGALQRLLWPDQPSRSSRLSVHLHNLRAVLDDGTRPPLLHTVGGGYLLAVDPPPSARRVRRPRRIG